MSEVVLLGKGDELIPISRTDWESHLSQVPQMSQARLAFMTADHHQVRNFVVQELPRTGTPIPPENVAKMLGLTLDRVHLILDDLEKNLFFIVRNARGEVSWAFPVTVEITSHEMRFQTEERFYGA